MAQHFIGEHKYHNINTVVLQLNIYLGKVAGHCCSQEWWWWNRLQVLSVAAPSFLLLILTCKKIMFFTIIMFLQENPTCAGFTESCCRLIWWEMWRNVVHRGNGTCHCKYYTSSPICHSESQVIDYTTYLHLQHVIFLLAMWLPLDRSIC